MSLALRAASLASLQAAGSLSAMPRAITAGPEWETITSQYQWPSPLGITRNSTFSAMVHLASSLYRLYQGAICCTAFGAQKSNQSGLASKRRDLRHSLHFMSALFTQYLIHQIHYHAPLTGAILA